MSDEEVAPSKLQILAHSAHSAAHRTPLSLGKTTGSVMNPPVINPLMCLKAKACALLRNQGS